MASDRRARIIGAGVYLPSKEVSNFDLEKVVDTNDEWIVSRTGIHSRRFAEKTEYSSTMGSKAALMALENAGKAVGDIELIIVATMSGDYPSPSTAALIQHEIRAEKSAAMDILAACSGFVYALSTAKAYVESGIFNTVLVIAAEKMSSLLDFSDRSTCVLFGDGASAVVVSSHGKGWGIGPVCMGADGNHADLVIVQGGGTRHPTTIDTLNQGLHYFRMKGKELYRHVIKKAVGVAQECLSRAGITPHELSWMIPHQANQRMMDAIAKGINLPLEKVYSVVAKYGNTSAAGIGIALNELITNRASSKDETILLNAFGGGLTWVATILKHEDGS